MCGILGYFGNRVGQFSRETSLMSIQHRGPDAYGEVSDKDYYLGHTRLSILDVSDLANQPMFTKDRSAVIIFNGEIYNHLELRDSELSEQKFTSTGDTETLIYGLKKYGVDFIKKLNGIFAFSYLDLNNNNFIIVRDHFGVKPLYYHINDKEICFSSELKSITNFIKKPTLNQGALKNYINFLWSPGELTPYNEVKKLLPGHYISGDLNKINQISFKRYYTIPFDGNYLNDKTEGQLIDELEERLVLVVKRQMLSDVPLGFFLSGGLDSSIIVAIARKLFPNKELNCYTIRTSSTDGFTDDLYYAKKVAKHTNVNLKIVEADVNILESFDKIIYHLDEPQADAAPINIYNICKTAREDGIKVLLGGTAGDDLFSGYRRHQALKVEALIEKTPLIIRKLIKNLFSNLNKNNSFVRRGSKLTANFEKPKEDRMLGYFSWLNNETINGLFLNSEKHDFYTYFKSLNKMIPKEKSDLNKMLFWEMNTFLTDHNLNYTDKLSMAAGVEVRVPFLDIELVEFSTKIPPKFKLKGNETKYLLKKVAEKYLPKEVIYRPKTGFGAPVRDWVINKMDTQIDEYLNKESVNNRGVFNYEKIAKLIEDNKKGLIDASYPIWSLLAIESWMRQFYDNK